MADIRVVFCLIGLLMLLGSRSASAATYQFLGYCEMGCDGFVTARLRLGNSYTNTIGDKTANLVLFRYDSSNVLIDMPPTAPFESVFQGSLFNDIPFASAVPEVLQAGATISFETSQDGSWMFSCPIEVCGTLVQESGTESVWQLTAVPIPAAAWLFGSALLGLGAIARKRA